jgi:hypothetical protein
MRHVLVRYTLRPECLQEHLALLDPVFDELAHSRPAGLRYSVARSTDGLAFVHIVAIDGPVNPLAALPSFLAFTRDSANRCEAPPVAMDVTIVRDYGLFG